MLDLLEFVLDFVLDVLFSAFDLEGYWRFGVPVLGALVGVVFIDWRIASSGARAGLSVAVVVAGILTGIFWQRRSG